MGERRSIPRSRLEGRIMTRPVHDVAAWLGVLLANGPVLQTDIAAAAEDTGYSWATVRRAKGRIGAISQKRGKWEWRLPATDKALETEDQPSHDPELSTLGTEHPDAKMLTSSEDAHLWDEVSTLDSERLESEVSTLDVLHDHAEPGRAFHFKLRDGDGGILVPAPSLESARADLVLKYGDRLAEVRPV
jgi:hypothetical protein